MKNNHFKLFGKLNSLFFLLSLFLFINCQTKVSIKKEVKTSNEELEALIKAQVDSLYKVYTKFDYDWINFYEDKFTGVYPETPIEIITKDSLKSQWKRIYDKYDVKLISRGEPSVIVSEDMAISHNSFNEIFINKKTNDTIKNVGTYIIAWKRQSNDSWKIVFETLHNN